MEEDSYQVTFVPKRLKVDDKPEFNHFPVNILFASIKKKDNKQKVRYSVYLPDLSTYTENDKNQGMEYYNVIDRNYWLWILRNKESGSYIGFKYRGPRCNPESLGSATGINYEVFFRFFTALGVKE